MRKILPYIITGFICLCIGGGIMFSIIYPRWSTDRERADREQHQAEVYRGVADRLAGSIGEAQASAERANANAAELRASLLRADDTIKQLRSWIVSQNSAIGDTIKRITSQLGSLASGDSEIDGLIGQIEEGIRGALQSLQRLPNGNASPSQKP